MENVVLTALFGIVTMANNYEQRKVAYNNIDGYEVDTCWVTDYRCYETAIAKDGHLWIVVERYYDEDNAKLGHNKWCEFVKDKPETAYSIQFDEIETF